MNLLKHCSRSTGQVVRREGQPHAHPFITPSRGPEPCSLRSAGLFHTFRNVDTQAPGLRALAAPTAHACTQAHPHQRHRHAEENGSLVLQLSFTFMGLCKQHSDKKDHLTTFKRILLKKVKAT